MSDLTRLTLADARAGLKKKEFSATELTQAFVKAIASRSGCRIGSSPFSSCSPVRGPD